MSLKAELETWSNALKAYEQDDFDQALLLFNSIADSSKILTNMGLIYATLGEHEVAVEQFIAATGLDQYLAVAYFQCGVSNFLLQRYELALKDFEEALLYLRGNQAINYEQLGLKFKLYSAEVLFNKGLAQIYMNRIQEGVADMEEARREKATEEHNVIDDAIQDRGEGYTVFSIPVGVLYRPPESKLKNSKTKDYMGKAKLVAASDSSDAYTTFTGVTRLKQGISPSGVFVDQESNSGLSRSATAPPVSTRKESDFSPSSGLGRSKTTINVPANARERITGGTSSELPPRPTVSRSNTLGAPGRSSPAPMTGPTRGLSLRRPSEGNTGLGPGRPQARGPPVTASPPPAQAQDQSRMTEFYDDYIDSYGDEPPPPPLPQKAPGGPERVAAWARSNANPAYSPQRQPSRSAPASSYAPSSAGTDRRRKVTRRPTQRAPSRVISTYEEEEEGYVSGDYEDAPFELIKIRVKLHYEDDVRGMALTPEMPFEEFLERVTSKFGRSTNGMAFKFKDEDGGKVTLQDESDFELAIETARESAKGKPEGKLEIWCTNI